MMDGGYLLLFGGSAMGLGWVARNDVADCAVFCSLGGAECVWCVGYRVLDHCSDSLL
jgi:hypothetical protein